jgi:hypothetical protein
MIVVPVELTEREIHQMTREQLIETLLGHTNYFSVRLTATGLEQYSTDELRRLLFEVQEHYRGKTD